MSEYAKRFGLDGKRALVTGASRGIGAEIATVFADAGADVAIVGRDAKGLEETRQAIAAKGRRCLVIEADLATVEGPRDAGRKALEFFGAVDVLVNNAGVFHRKTLLEATVEEWDETQAVNVRAPFLLAQVLAPAMMAQRSGKIVNISTVAATVGCEGHASYSASKGGLNLLTRVLAAELGPFNIQTNAVSPTVVLTAMGKEAWGDEAKAAPVKARIPLRRFGEPLEIADLVLFLASRASDFICGDDILIDGGYAAV
jgi:NAD(P)-dependent dehydrogenase (short-subunit alcohol dehydrogenase family)